MVAASELSVNINASALNMAQTIFGDGATVVGASYTGDFRSSGTYSGGNTTSPGVTPGDSGVILSTGYARDFTNSWGNANQSGSTSTNTWGPNGNAQFNAAAGTYTYDASYLDVDFIPTGNTLTMQFVFASDEYPEYTNSIYNDFVGIWVNGTNVPLEIGGNSSVGNVNQSSNENLFVNNTGSQYNTEMDGFTVTMTVKIPVVPGQVNSIRIGIADVADSSYDSSVLIAADSVQSTLLANHDTKDVYVGGSTTIDVLANDVNSTGGTVTVTHINGIAVNAGDSVTLTTGEVVTLNPDMTLSVDADNDLGAVNFTYQIQSSLGGSDTGFVTLNTVPCFVAGTLIATPDGPRVVQNLRPGDLVETMDDGPQPVRWIGRRTVRADGDLAPIAIAAGTFGDHGRVAVSPLHRILVQGHGAELLFGDPEVLVAARDLVDDVRVRRMPGGWVEYVHILFDRHQIVLSNGLATESYLPGCQTSDSYAAEILVEISSIFPEFDPDTGDGYGPAARRTLKAYEARLLANRALVA